MNRYIFVALFFPLMAFADLQPFFNMGEPTDVTSTTASAVALAQDVNRRVLIVQNKGLANVYVKFGAAHSGIEGLHLSPAQIVQFYPAPINSVYLKSSSGTNLVTLQVGK